MLATEIDSKLHQRRGRGGSPTLVPVGAEKRSQPTPLRPALRTRRTLLDSWVWLGATGRSVGQDLSRRAEVSCCTTDLGSPGTKTTLKDFLRPHAMMRVRGSCALCSRPVCFTPSSSAVGCTLPFASVAREVTVCSPGVALSQV